MLSIGFPKGKKNNLFKNPSIFVSVNKLEKKYIFKINSYP